MARKLRGFERVLDAPSLFAVAYGEIASSLYIALGIVAAVALGLTPLVLLLTGALFFVVSLSYAEGTAAIPETGGAATFVRRASNDLAGFLTGWALFLDFLIVMALSALFVPHYLGEALSVTALRNEPWDAIVGCAVIAAIAAVRLARRTRLHVGSLVVALLDLVVQGVLVVLGIGFLLSPETLSEGLGFATGQDWSDLAFALPARDARLHRPRDRGQPRRGGARAGTDSSALLVLGHRAGRRRHGADRRNRPLGLPGLRRRDGARRGVARGAARRDHGRVRGIAARVPGRRPSHRSRDLGRADPDRGGDNVRSPASRG